MLVNQYKSFFKNEFVNILARQFTKSIEKSINTNMLGEQNLKEIGEGTGILLNCSLIGDPILHQDYMAIPFDGTFLVNGSIEVDSQGGQFDRTDEEYKREIKELQESIWNELETHHDDG